MAPHQHWGLRQVMDEVAKQLPNDVGVRELSEEQRRAERQANRVRPGAGGGEAKKGWC